jgi:hypothetical protein
METSSEKRPVKSKKTRLKEVKLKKPRSKNQKDVKPRKPRSKEQAIKCQFCPRSFSFLHWNNGKTSFSFNVFQRSD